MLLLINFSSVLFIEGIDITLPKFALHLFIRGLMVWQHGMSRQTHLTQSAEPDD